MRNSALAGDRFWRVSRLKPRGDRIDARVDRLNTPFGNRHSVVAAQRSVYEAARRRLAAAALAILRRVNSEV